MERIDKKTLISDYAVEMLRPPKGKSGVVFLSGGSALAEVSEHLSLYKIPSVHLITPFDSGGSSRLLRSAFEMPAVGDIRNRMLSLCRIDLVGHALPELCSLRFDSTGPEYELRNKLKSLYKGEHAMMIRLDAEQRRQVCFLLKLFFEHIPDGFSLRGASVGNLLLVGAYISSGCDLYTAVEAVAKLLQVEGTVLPVTDASLHLAGRFENGDVLVGQHLITGKEVPGPESAIEEIYLTPAWPGTDATPRKRNPEVASQVTALIRQASCICYPMGSFYTSLIANLLPRGVGKAIDKAQCYKVYIPSAGVDPETQGLSVADQVERLLWYLRQDAGENTPTGNLLTHVFYDSEVEYSGGVEAERILNLGVELVDMDLLYPNYSTTHYEPYLFLHALADLLAVEG